MFDMATSDCDENDNDFHRAVAYALSSVHRDGFVLKPKQAEAIKFIYDEEDVFLWLYLQVMENLFATMIVLPFLFDYKLGTYDHTQPRTGP